MFTEGSQAQNAHQNMQCLRAPTQCKAPTRMQCCHKLRNMPMPASACRPGHVPVCKELPRPRGLHPPQHAQRAAGARGAPRASARAAHLPVWCRLTCSRVLGSCPPFAADGCTTATVVCALDRTYLVTCSCRWASWVQGSWLRTTAPVVCALAGTRLVTSARAQQHRHMHLAGQLDLYPETLKPN